jgi:hypothetical protein
MIEIMPFGRHNGDSIEQIALKDYKYFRWLLGECNIRKPSLKERVNFVYYVANNFVPQVKCAGCANRADYISLYHGYGRLVTTDASFVYCSENCWRSDPRRGDDHKLGLSEIKFDTAFQGTKWDTNLIIKEIAICMGMTSGKKTKEYLHDFFDKMQLKVPYR